MTAVKRVTDIMAEISAESAEQSAGIEQVNQAITQMDQVTQQNAALVEESAAAAEAMKEQAQSLISSVSVFKLGEEEYGIDIQKVQELRGYDAVTRIANAPDYIKGVVNLRGIIVPIIDMRIKFKLGDPTYDQFTVVIVLNIGGRVVGMVVDSVSDVITLTGEQIKPAPEMGSVLDADYLIGLGTLDERMLILVDIDRLMSSDEMGLVEKMAA